MGFSFHQLVATVAVLVTISAAAEMPPWDPRKECKHWVHPDSQLNRNPNWLVSTAGLPACARYCMWKNRVEWTQHMPAKLVCATRVKAWIKAFMANCCFNRRCGSGARNDRNRALTYNWMKHTVCGQKADEDWAAEFRGEKTVQHVCLDDTIPWLSFTESFLPMTKDKCRPDAVTAFSDDDWHSGPRGLKLAPGEWPNPDGEYPFHGQYEMDPVWNPATDPLGTKLGTSIVLSWVPEGPPF